MPTDLNHIDALVLCGGLGKRLRPVVGETQKVMAEVGGVPFLDLILDYLGKEGLRRAVLCAGFQAEQLQAHYKSKKTNLAVDFSIEKEPLGTGGAVKNAKGFIKSDPFFVFNGDSFCRLVLKNFLEFHKSRAAIASVAVSKVNNAGDFGSMTMDASGKITAFDEKLKSTAGYVNAGVYCFDKKIFDFMPDQAVFSIEKDFFPGLTGRPFFGFVTKEVFYDIGTPERYQTAQEKLRKER